MPARQEKRFAPDGAAQFEERDDRAREGNRADTNADEDLGEMQMLLAGCHRLVRPEIRRKPDQHRRQISAGHLEGVRVAGHPGGALDSGA